MAWIPRSSALIAVCESSTEESVGGVVFQVFDLGEQRLDAAPVFISDKLEHGCPIALDFAGRHMFALHAEGIAVYQVDIGRLHIVLGLLNLSF
jgi:hypothetical protein